MTLVHRIDTFRGQLQKPVKTAQGFLLCEGYVARPGVYVYRHADGSITRELVLEEDLHDPLSLATLARAPLTLLHPEVDVTPDNVDKYGVGDVDGDVHIERPNGFVKIHMAARRKDALSAIENGVEELSPGYTVELENTSGVHPVHGEYDAIQRKRRYNHVAIVPTARGGANMRLRKDAAYQVINDDPIQPQNKRGPTMDKAQVVAIVAELLKKDKEEQQRKDAEDKYVTKEDMNKMFDGFMTKIKDMMGHKNEEGGEGGEGTPPKNNNDSVDDPRVLARLMKRADAWDVEYDDKTVTISELQKAIVLKHNDTVRNDGDDAYYAALLDTVPDAPAKAQDPYSQITLPPKRNDGAGTGNPQPPALSPRERGFAAMRKQQQ